MRGPASFLSAEKVWYQFFLKMAQLSTRTLDVLSKDLGLVRSTYIRLLTAVCNASS